MLYSTHFTAHLFILTKQSKALKISTPFLLAVQTNAAFEYFCIISNVPFKSVSKIKLKSS